MYRLSRVLASIGIVEFCRYSSALAKRWFVQVLNGIVEV